MKRILTTILIAAALAGGTAHAAPRQIQDRERFCRYGSVDPGRWTEREVDLTIACSVKHWPVPGGFSFAHFISTRESGDAWYARNATSGACGIYQHIPSLWPSRVQHFNATHPRWNASGSCLNARSNVLVSIAMAHAGGWGPWGQ